MARGYFDTGWCPYHCKKREPAGIPTTKRIIHVYDVFRFKL